MKKTCRGAQSTVVESSVSQTTTPAMAATTVRPKISRFDGTAGSIGLITWERKRIGSIVPFSSSLAGFLPDPVLPSDP